MSAAVATFDQIECRADRALAFTLWAKHVKHFALCVAATSLLNVLLKSLVDDLTAEKLNSLSSEQAVELTKKLQELHAQLVAVLTMRGIEHARSAFLLGGQVRGLDERAEDLGDIIDDLVMSECKEFRTLLKECVQDISATPAGTIARM